MQQNIIEKQKQEQLEAAIKHHKGSISRISLCTAFRQDYLGFCNTEHKEALWHKWTGKVLTGFGAGVGIFATIGFGCTFLNNPVLTFSLSKKELCILAIAGALVSYTSHRHARKYGTYATKMCPIANAKVRE